MVHEDRQRESFSRRRLDFTQVSSPVYGKTFYLDLRKPLLKEKVIKCVRRLGGKIEDFLSKEVHLFITDRSVSVSDSRDATLKDDQAENPSSPNCVPLPSPDTPVSTKSSNSSSLFGPCSAKPLTRTQTLLLKAQQSYGRKQTHSTDISCSSTTIQNAVSMGIKVMSASAFLGTYQQETRKIKAEETFRFQEDPSLAPGPTRSTRASGRVPTEQKENQPCVKVEDFSRKYKPLFKNFERLPEISYELGLNSRTSNSKKRQKTTPRTVSVPATPKDSRTCQKSVPRPSTVKGPKCSQRGGYCESCDYWYTGKVREHLAGSRHQHFAKNVENYKSLDDVISKLPGLGEFMYSVKQTSNIDVKIQNYDVEMKDLSRGTGVINAGNVRIDVLTSVQSRGLNNEPDNQPTRILEVDKRCPDVIETDDTPQTIHKPKVLRKLLAKCRIKENSDTYMSENGDGNTDTVKKTTESTTVSTKTVPVSDEIDHDILNIANSVSRNMTHFEENDDDQFESSQVEPPVLVRADSVDTVVSMVTDSAPVLQPVKPLQESSLNVSCSRRASPRKRLDFGNITDSDSNTNDAKQSSLLELSVPKSFTFSAGLSEVSTSFGQTSSDTVSVTESMKMTRKRRRSRGEPQNLYYATKTSEMKLKLCRVTQDTLPLKYKKDLKSYWKVRKSGDCKLVFSPKYSRKSSYRHRASRRLDVSNQENDAATEIPEPQGKRQRVDVC